MESLHFSAKIVLRIQVNFRKISDNRYVRIKTPEAPFKEARQIICNLN